jgi:hypothetical protein
VPVASESAYRLHRSVDCSFGPFVPNLRFVADTALEITLPSPAGPVVQTVEIAPVTLRGGLLLLSWTETDGTVVVHVHDYDAMVVHSHARLADGTLLRSVGTLAWRD